MIVAMNLVTMLLIALTGELVLRRMNAKANSQGVEVLGTTLLPKDWKTVSDWNHSILEKTPRANPTSQLTT